MRKIHLIASITVLALLAFASSHAQVTDPSKPIRVFQVNTWAGYYASMGNLSQRFGPGALVGLELSQQFKNGWKLGLSGGHFFGAEVLERDIMSNIATPSGDIITEAGIFEDYRLRSFGWALYGRLGKVFPIAGSNPNSGILIDLGVGVFQHKIWIETPTINSPQLMGDYKKGYDRLTNGLSINPFIGYQYLSNNKLINFYAGVDFHNAWTQGRRTVNFNTGLADNTPRIDQLIGFRAGWILPLYRRAEKELMFY